MGYVETLPEAAGRSVASDQSVDAQPPRPLDRLMMYAIIGLLLTIIAGGLAVVFDLQRITVLDRISADVASKAAARFSSDLAAAHTSDHRTALAGGFQALAYLVMAIVWLAWFFRAYRNLPRIGVRYLRHRSGCAIGAWFVPILSLFWPKRITNDLWRGSDPDIREQQLNLTSPVPRWVHWWWGLFLLVVFFASYSAHTWSSAQSLSSLKDAAIMDIIAIVIGSVVALLTILLAYRITERQDQRIRALQATSVIRT
jgi:hypothetical protein